MNNLCRETEHHPQSSSQRWACPEDKGTLSQGTLSQRSQAGTALPSSATSPEAFTAPTRALTPQGHSHLLCSRRNKNLTLPWCVNASNPKCSVKHLTESLILLEVLCQVNCHGELSSKEYSRDSTPSPSWDLWPENYRVASPGHRGSWASHLTQQSLTGSLRAHSTSDSTGSWSPGQQ